MIELKKDKKHNSNQAFNQIIPQNPGTGFHISSPNFGTGDISSSNWQMTEGKDNENSIFGFFTEIKLA